MFPNLVKLQVFLPVSVLLHYAYQEQTVYCKTTLQL